MVEKNNKKKTFTTRSIYLGEDDFDLDKEVNKLAKKDENIPKHIAEKKSSLVSHVTIKLWKLYIQSAKQGKSILKFIKEEENEHGTT